MRSWSPAGAAVVILAACLGVGWTAALVTTLAYAATGRPVSRDALAALAGLGQTMAGTLGGLLGGLFVGRDSGTGGGR